MSKNGDWFYSAIARQIRGAMDRDEDNRLSRAELRQIVGKEDRIFYLKGRIEALEVRGDGY